MKQILVGLILLLIIGTANAVDIKVAVEYPSNASVIYEGWNHFNASAYTDNTETIDLGILNMTMYVDGTEVNATDVSNFNDTKDDILWYATTGWYNTSVKTIEVNLTYYTNGTGGDATDNSSIITLYLTPYTFTSNFHSTTSAVGNIPASCYSTSTSGTIGQNYMINLTLYADTVGMNSTTEQGNFSYDIISWTSDYGEHSMVCRYWNVWNHYVDSSAVTINTSDTSYAFANISQNASVLWDTDYIWRISCAPNSTNILRRVCAGLVCEEVPISIYFPTNLTTNITASPNEVNPNGLAVCGEEAGIIVDTTFTCVYDGFNVTTTHGLSSSTSAASCIFTGTTNMTTNNYTVNYMNDTYMDISFVSTADGMLLMKWELPIYATGQNGTGNLRCSNATVIQTYVDGNNTYGFGNATILVYGGSAKRVICEIDPQYRSTGTSSIPAEATVVTLVIVGVGVYIYRRQYS